MQRIITERDNLARVAQGAFKERRDIYRDEILLKSILFDLHKLFKKLIFLSNEFCGKISKIPSEKKAKKKSD